MEIGDTTAAAVDYGVTPLGIIQQLNNHQLQLDISILPTRAAAMITKCWMKDQVLNVKTLENGLG